MKKIGEYNADDSEKWLKRQTPLGLAVKAGLVVVGLFIACGALSYALGWVGEGARLVSPTNVKAQWQFSYDNEESLRAIATQWCTAKQAEKEAPDPDTLSQRQSQTIAIQENYARVEATYNAQLEDAFRAKYVKPSDVPSRAPTLQDEEKKEGCPVQP